MKTQYRKSSIVDLENLQNTYEITNHDILNEYSPFHITGLQHYNPMYSGFFDLDETNVLQTTLKHKYAIHDLHTVVDVESGELVNKPVFVKFSPLLDPIKYMIGKYDVKNDAIYTLPGLTNAEQCHPKLLDVNNASYVDCFFNYLSSQLLQKHGLVNAIDFYGSYLGIQEKYKMNISDDLEYLYTSKYFNENVGSLFKVSEEIMPNGKDYDNGSKSNKQKLNIAGSLKSHNISLIDLGIEELGENISHNEETTKTNENEVVYEKPCSYSSTSSSDNSSLNYSTDSDISEYEESVEESVEESGDKSVEESVEEETMFAYMDNFPIQMICLEKCEGTIDQLFEKGELSENEGASAMIQIIMTLIAYQRAFSFTHNDLHTNNIMYVSTKTPWLYYKYNKKTYKVPTYGRIFKIIDFGRSIYRFCGKIFCSDSFAPGGDAHTQYNCEPYMTENKPRLEPNPSFDLCRLGCSIYDFLIEDETEDDMDAFQKTIYTWCCDDNGKNILYKKDGEERYPNFKLYKMIARNVHGHSPQTQLHDGFFSQFLMGAKDAKKISNISGLIDIDKIPSYM